jgi:hypothetical protein
MNFSTDRDLLILEPTVFTDVPFASQQRVRTTDAMRSGVTLTSASADFVAAQVDAGGVVLLAGQALEVVARVDAHTLTVSLPRARSTDAPIPDLGAGVVNGELRVRTFAPQAAVVHDMLLRLVGIEPDDLQNPGALKEDAIVSLAVMARLEALGTLERVYSAAATITGDNEGLWKKAAYYRERFGQACDRTTILLDADGDGYDDLRRRAGVIRLIRT